MAGGVGEIVHGLGEWRAGPAPALDTAPMTAPEQLERGETEEQSVADRPWVTIVWNDPVNLMAYVTYVFQKLFGYSKQKAHRLMLAVHHEGKAVVSSGNREQMERDVNRLHAYGLWATLQQDS